ncbi:MAG: tripartite tricarboxylate transporter TctB family protein, partial [Candidatus Methylomirabilota bacterium]
DIVGFDLIGTIILFVLFASLRKGRLVSSFVIALVATCAIHYLFGHFLRVPLPWGIFVEYAFF